MPAMLSLAASRNIHPWAPTINLYYEGDPAPVAGATVAMQVRLYPGQPGAAKLSVPDIPYQDLAAPTGLRPKQRVLRLLPSVPKSALQAMPIGFERLEPGEAEAFAHDIIITYADGLQEKLALGDFLLEPGVYA
jgi:hypothetical protein